MARGQGSPVSKAANSGIAGTVKEQQNVRQIPPLQTGWRGKMQRILESLAFQRSITALIVINAITLGLETSAEVMAAVGGVLLVFDKFILAVFVVELVSKMVVYGRRFHKDPWNVFDFVVVSVALMPAVEGLSVLRALRILRVLRLVSSVPSMRRVVTALLAAIPGMGSIVGLLSLLFYVFSVMATKLFGASFPEWFGSIPESAYSLFQIMTLESWSMGIVRPVMEVYPAAWVFFLPFILVTSFTVLNLFIGIVVDAMQRQHDAEAKEERAQIDESLEAQAVQGHDERAEIINELKALRAEIQALREERGSSG